MMVGSWVDYSNRGSIHSDIWEGTAIDLAACGRVAVFPVTGWWKELRSWDFEPSRSSVRLVALHRDR